MGARDPPFASLAPPPTPLSPHPAALRFEGMPAPGDLDYIALQRALAERRATERRAGGGRTP